MISLLVPWFGGSPTPLIRTRDSAQGIVDETVVVHQQLFDDDAEVVRSIASKVVTIDWNAVFRMGFGEMTNQGLRACGSNWVVWLGTGETIAEQYVPMRDTLASWSNKLTTFRCNHLNDVHTWRRVFCPAAGVRVGGLIHEDVKGEEGPVMFRMQDTIKERHDEEFRNECAKWHKTCSYNYLYQRLGQNPQDLSYTDPGWLGFVNGAKASIDAFCEEHRDLIGAAVSGDRQAFYDGVRRRMDAERPAQGVNFEPLGNPTSGNETITLESHA